MSHDVDLRRFINREANLLQLLGLAVLIFASDDGAQPG